MSASDWGITKREREILIMVGRGLTNVEIGKRLHIARTTAVRRLTGIISKLGCKNRTKAVFLALKFGIITLDALLGNEEAAEGRKNADRRK